jgi:hypothetical protein
VSHPLEAGDEVRIKDRNLAIEDQRLRRERADGVHEIGEPLRELLATRRIHGPLNHGHVRHVQRGGLRMQLAH